MMEKRGEICDLEMAFALAVITTSAHWLKNSGGLECSAYQSHRTIASPAGNQSGSVM